MTTATLKKLTLNLPPDLHKALKMLAAAEGKSMTDIALAGIRKIIGQIGKNNPDIIRVAPGVVLERVTDENMTDEERAAMREAEEDRKAGRMKPIESLDDDQSTR